MGDIEGHVEDASPPSEVTLTRAFAMQQTEVTQKQWIEVLGEAPSYPHRTDSPYLPVENLSIDSALAFCNALSDLERYEPCHDLSDCWGSPAWGELDCGGVPDISLDCEDYRLPTEAEWEHAARAGTSSQGAWFEEPGGSLVDPDKFERVVEQYRPMPVGFSPPNPWGLYNRLGNVAELVWDGDSTYPGVPQGDWVGPQTLPLRIACGCDYYIGIPGCTHYRGNVLSPYS
jgi:formylglycine-generating enzyme required for sulfatase activity